MSEDTPEAGTRVTVETDEGSEVAVYTGHTFASEDGSRLIEGVKSWQEAPLEDELKVTGVPDELPEAPRGVPGE